MDTIEEGSKGNNIKLTIDLAFQDSVDAFAEKLFQFRQKWWSQHSERCMVVLNPKTGAVCLRQDSNISSES